MSVSAHVTAEIAKCRILVVDDIEDNRVILERHLSREGFTVSACDGGIAAIGQVASDPPDLIILDWMMPLLSGLDTLKAIREHYDANRLPVIMCTARDEESSIGSAIEAGANDYIQKPVRVPVLLARITAQLIRKAATDALGALNQDLEQTLAQRTRALLEYRCGQRAEER
jgi:DNA-binding response OmpR family regulator